MIVETPLDFDWDSANGKIGRIAEAARMGRLHVNVPVL